MAALENSFLKVDINTEGQMPGQHQAEVQYYYPVLYYGSTVPVP